MWIFIIGQILLKKILLKDPTISTIICYHLYLFHYRDLYMVAPLWKDGCISFCIYEDLV